MADKFKVITGTLSADVANAGTFTVGYPTGTNAATFQNGFNHKLVIAQNVEMVAPQQFSLTFGASTITVTNASGSTWLAGAAFYVQADILGGTLEQADLLQSSLEPVIPAPSVVINLKSPVVGSSTAVAASQAVLAATASGALINGGVATSSVATFDVPRNVIAAWTGTSVITVTGTDVNGSVVVESSASGTSLAGKKAFKTVTKITVSADVTGFTAGSGNVLGLPVYLPTIALILKEIEDNAVATAGTPLAGINSKATATTGDVRGTYVPNSTPDGTKVFRLVVALPDPKYQGATQFAG